MINTEQQDTEFDTAAYLASLSDTELLERFDEAFNDCQKAGEEEKDSEHHQECFAATLVLAEEMRKRGLRQPTKH